MTTNNGYRVAWAVGMTVVAALLGAGAYTAAHARGEQAVLAPPPRTVEPIPSTTPSAAAEISLRPATVTLPNPSEKPLRPELPSLTFNPGEVPPAAPIPDALPPATGDTPVTLTKQTILSSLLGAALAAAPVSAQGDSTKPVDVKAELKEMKDQLSELKTAQKQISDVILGRNEGRTLEDAGLQKRLDALAESIRKLDEKVTRIGEQVATTQRTAGSSPLTGNVTPKGTVRLVNDYAVDVSIVLNGVSYVLPPGQRRDVAVAPGDFGYALPQSGGMETRSKIKDGETVTLRIR
jgi:hypothetical protein